MTPVEFLAVSSVDSARFGLKIARGTVPPLAPADAVLEAVRRSRPDVAIFRCQAGDPAQVHALRNAGFCPIHADTLVHYRGQLEGAPDPGALSGVVAVARAGASDSADLAAIAARAFAGYRSHYHANPLFGAQQILQGYVEWAATGATAEDVQAWRVVQAGETRGFATCRTDTALASVEVLLNAVDPQWQGKGVYTALLAAIMRRYRELGMRTINISTQVWNYRVQRVWTRLGLELERAEDTYHLNLPALGVPA